MSDVSAERLKAILEQNLDRKIVPEASDRRPSEPTRLLNGRGGLIPGFSDLNIDLYPPLLFITVYCEYSDEDISLIADVISVLFPQQPVIIQDRSVRPSVIRLQKGSVPIEMIIAEAGLRFYLHPMRGQNPGFFTDMRSGRLYIREFISRRSAESEDINVLNLFAYTCSLSVAALSAGASKVVNIDKNRRSLEIGKKNHLLNSDRIPGGYRNQAVMLPHDIFKSIGRLRREGPYDLIIADPPPSQKGSFMMIKDYPRILKRLPEMMKPAGRIFLTQNGAGWTWEDFESMINNNLPDFSFLQRIDPPDDFNPHTVGRGLKIIIAERQD